MTLRSVAATAAVAAMALVATGDIVLATVLLAVAAGEVVAGPGAVLAGAAVLVRWGTSSLGGVGADQAVLGFAGGVGPPLAAASAWCAAGALVSVPRRQPLAAIAAGALAALVVAGPTDTGGWWVRAIATVVAIVLSGVAYRTLGRRVAVVASIALGVAALVTAMAA